MARKKRTSPEQHNEARRANIEKARAAIADQPAEVRAARATTAALARWAGHQSVAIQIQLRLPPAIAKKFRLEPNKAGLVTALLQRHYAED